MMEESFWVRFWAMAFTLAVTVVISTTMYWTNVNAEIAKLIEGGACPLEVKYSLDPGNNTASETLMLMNHKCVK